MNRMREVLFMANSSVNTWESSVELFNKVSLQTLNLYKELSNSTIKIIDYSENATYLAENSELGEKYILRVCRPNYHTKEEIESEVHWLQSIDENTSIIVSRPILGLNNEYIQTVKLDDHPFEYYCVLFTFLDGEEPNVDNEDKLIRIFGEIGRTTAQMHEHVFDNWESFKKVKRPVWNYDSILGEHPKWARWQDGLGITPERLRLFGEVSRVIKSRLDRFGQDCHRFGLIHADLRHANLLIKDGEVKVIDFDDSGFGWYLYDLAASLTFIEHRSYVPKLIEAWLKGYREVRALSEDEENEIPTFVMMRRLQLIAWVGSRDNETTQELGSEYTEQTDELARVYLNNFDYPVTTE